MTRPPVPSQAVASDITPLNPNSLLHRELWSSWASVLRSYAAVHSLGLPLHAVVEVSDQEILLRYGIRWLRFTPTALTTSEGHTASFHLTVNGQAVVDTTTDEMDLAAERLCREIIIV